MVYLLRDTALFTLSMENERRIRICSETSDTRESPKILMNILNIYLTSFFQKIGGAFLKINLTIFFKPPFHLYSPGDHWDQMDSLLAQHLVTRERVWVHVSIGWELSAFYSITKRVGKF